MKRNFLLMLLLTLLPLAGWAQTLSFTSATYDGSSHSLPTATIGGNTIPVSTSTYVTYGGYRYRIDKWTKGGSTVTEYEDAGTYIANVQRRSDYYGSFGDYTTLTLTVNKGTNVVSPDPTISGWKYGTTPVSPSGSAAKWGFVEYQYSVNGTDGWGDYATVVNGESGDYYVSAYVPADGDNYDAVRSAAVPFSISPSEVTVKVFGINRVWDTPWTDPTIADFNADATLRQVTGDAGWDAVKGYLTFSRVDEGTDVGSYQYTLNVDPSAGKNLLIHVDNAAGKLNIEQATNVVVDASKVTIADWTYGQTASTPANANAFKYGNDKVVYTYAKKGTTDFTDEVPTEAGEYTLKATVPEDLNYTPELTVTVNFEIKKADLTPVSAVDAEAIVTGLTYTGEDQKLLKGEFPLPEFNGTGYSGTFTYYIDGTPVVGTWEDVVGKDADEALDAYEITYTFVPNSTNFNAITTPQSAGNANIAKANLTPASIPAGLIATGLEYTGADQKLLTDAAPLPQFKGVGQAGSFEYFVDGTSAGSDWENVVGQDADEVSDAYEITYTFAPTSDNFNAITTPVAIGNANIAKAFVPRTGGPAVKTTALTYNGAEQGLLQSGKYFTGIVGGHVVYYAKGAKETDAAEFSAYSDVKKMNADTYTVSYKFFADDDNHKDDENVTTLTPTITINKLEIAVGANEVTGTIESLYDLTTTPATPKYNIHQFLEDVTVLAVDNAERDNILDAIVTVKSQPVFDDLKLGANNFVFEATSDEENNTNYKANVIGKTGVLTINPIEAAIQEVPEPTLGMIYNGEDLELVAKAAVGYKAEAGTGTVEIGKVVYSLEEAGEYTDDLTKIVGKDADEYTVYYKVALDEKKLDRFYEYTAGVKNIKATIAQKDLADEMFVLTPTEAVYNGSNQLPVITTKAGEPIVGDDYDFEFADGKGIKIDDITTGVTNVDTYTITFKAEADGNYTGTASATWTITKADATCSAPEPLLGLIYNGEDLALVAEPTYDGGTLEYSLDGTNWSEDIPTGKNADTYEVYYRVVADGNHNDFTCTDPVEATIAPKTLTKDMFVFEKTEQPFTGEVLKFEYAVADAEAAILTASDYVCEKDDVIIDADEYEFKFTGKENYTGTFTVTCTVTPIMQNFVAPEAINLTYNATDQALVTEATTDAVAGSMEQPAGKIEYQVTFGNEVLVPWTEDYAAVVGYNAGDYQVKYRVTASEKNYTNPLIEGDVDVEILRANVGYMLSNLEKTWDGNTFTEEEVATVFTLYAGELFGPDVYDVPFVLTLPEDYKDAGGPYTFKQAKVVFKEGYPENYKVNCSGTAEIVIDKADITAEDFTAPSEKVGMIFNGTDIELVKAGEVTTEYEGEPIGTVLYATAEDGEYSEKVPTAKAAGEYEVWYKVQGDKNHNDTKAVKLDAVIATKAVDWAISFDDAIGEDALLYNTKNQMPKVEVTDGNTALVKGTDYTMTIAFTPANETGPLADFEPAELVNVGKYVFTFKGINNYNGEAIRTIEIAPADLAENVTMSKFEATKVYNAKDQKPAITLTYEGYTLEADKDFTVVAADEMINAGEYEFVFTALAGGNYTGEANATFTIEKKEAIAEAADATKVYDGTDAFKELPVLTFKNVELADDPATAFAYEADAFVFDKLSANVGTYAFTVDVEKIESDNYYVSQANGANFTITPAKLMVNWNSEADPFTKVYGEKDPELKATTANLDITGAVAGEEEDIAAQTAITRAEGEEVGEYAITLAAAKNAKVFDNYEVQFTGADAAFVITPATVKVSIASLEKVYDGEAATIEVKAEDLIVTGLQNGDKKEDIFTTLPTATVADGKAVNVGTYEVTLAGAVAGDYEVEYMTSTFDITPRKITTATIDFQQIQAGQKVEDFIDPAAFTIEGVVEKDAKFFYVDVNPDYQDFDGVVTADPDTYEDGLVIAVDDEVADNYTGYDKFYGELLVIAADAVVLNDNESWTTEAKKKADVTFSDRVINYGTWNVVALPFEASVAQISEAFGYAAVDVLNETASDGSIHFQVITSGSVPAYTPFIVKTTADEELVKKNFNQVVFHGVDIEAWDGENNAVTDAAKNKFWGTFQAETKIGGQKYWYMSKGAWKDARNFNIETKPITLKPFRAFVEFDEVNVAAGARIYIEEPDGTETAIDAIEFNQMVNGDTYTVGGMKVNKAQKGVYIQNGKKIAVK